MSRPRQPKRNKGRIEQTANSCNSGKLSHERLLIPIDIVIPRTVESKTVLFRPRAYDGCH